MDFTVDLMRWLCKNVPKLNTGARQCADSFFISAVVAIDWILWMSYFVYVYIFANANSRSCSHLIYQNILWSIYYVRMLFVAWTTAAEKKTKFRFWDSNIKYVVLETSQMNMLRAPNDLFDLSTFRFSLTQPLHAACWLFAWFLMQNLIWWCGRYESICSNDHLHVVFIQENCSQFSKILLMHFCDYVRS